MRQVGHPVMVEAAPVLTGAGAALFFPPPKVRRDEIRTQEPDAATHAFSEAHWSAPKRRQWEVAGAGFVWVDLLPSRLRLLTQEKPARYEPR